MSSTPASALPGGGGGLIRVRNEFYQPPQPVQTQPQPQIQHHVVSTILSDILLYSEMQSRLLDGYDTPGPMVLLKNLKWPKLIVKKVTAILVYSNTKFL